MSDDLIPSNTAENRLYGSLSCSTAQDFFYIDTDNISQAIMILRPTAQKIVHLLRSAVVWYFTHRFKHTFSIWPLPTLVALLVISCPIYMADTFVQASQSRGGGVALQLNATRGVSLLFEPMFLNSPSALLLSTRCCWPRAAAPLTPRPTLRKIPQGVHTCVNPHGPARGVSWGHISPHWFTSSYAVCSSVLFFFSGLDHH